VGTSERTNERRNAVALTRRQHEIYEFIRGFVSRKGYSPSLEEIGGHFGLSSVATVHKHVQHLVEKGYLKKAWNRSRSVEPVGASSPGSDTAGLETLPVLGVVAAGSPIEAIEDENAERVSVPAEMAGRPGKTFVLRVRGESMIDEQIRDGDLVVVEGRKEARNGETVVAVVGGSDATLKRFYKRGSQVKLVPANSEMEPIEVHASEVEIRGVLKGLLRQY
jgi:repressor LexA